MVFPLFVLFPEETDMGLKDMTVYRVYACTECKAEMACTQGIYDDFEKECPCCGDKDGLVIVRADIGVSMVVDATKPKTLGSLAEKNRETRQKRGEETEGFRKKKKRNFDILKDPIKYIQTGRT